MARAAKLKVYRTPIGFHDAYVAAPSQKAAMEAWGSGKDLFTRGEAELVTDPALTAEPLEKPGTVIKRLRGTVAEQLAALPPDEPRPEKPARDKADDPPARTAARKKPAKPPVPRPSRDELEAAEKALDAADERHRAERGELAAREAALARERRKLEQAQAAESDRLEQARDAAKRAYEAATRKWRG